MLAELAQSGHFTKLTTPKTQLHELSVVLKSISLKFVYTLSMCACLLSLSPSGCKSLWWGVMQPHDFSSIWQGPLRPPSWVATSPGRTWRCQSIFSLVSAPLSVDVCLQDSLDTMSVPSQPGLACPVRNAGYSSDATNIIIPFPILQRQWQCQLEKDAQGECCPVRSIGLKWRRQWTRLVVDAALRRIGKSRHGGHKIANISVNCQRI